MTGIPDDASKPAGKRIDELEQSVSQLKISAAKWTMLVGAAIALATALPISVWFTGILKQGADGKPGLETPVGSIIAWPSETPPDDRWVPCDGRPVAFDARLWSCLKQRYGNGETSKGQPILLPDYRGYFLRGAGQSATGFASRAEPPGRIVGTEQDHHVGPPAHWGGGDHFFVAEFAVPEDESSKGLSVVHRAAKKPENGSLETRPVNIAVTWLIRVK